MWGLKFRFIATPGNHLRLNMIRVHWKSMGAERKCEGIASMSDAMTETLGKKEPRSLLALNPDCGVEGCLRIMKTLHSPANF